MKREMETQTKLELARINTKKSVKQEQVDNYEEPLILDFREMIDGNFTIIVNGNKLKDQVDSGCVSIDLNNPVSGKSTTILDKVIFHKADFLRGALPKIIQQQISELENNKKNIFRFVKKYGFEALEVPVVKNYFRELVKTARDKNFPKKDECKKELKKLITAVSHTDMKVYPIIDISIPELVRIYEKLKEEAERFYPIVVEHCRYCEGNKSNYSNCLKKTKCPHIIDHIQKQFPDVDRKQIKKFLNFNSPSEYIAENFRSKLPVDRTRGEELQRYAKEMSELR